MVGKLGNISINGASHRLFITHYNSYFWRSFVFLLAKTKKNGFALIGTAFVFQFAYNVIFYAWLSYNFMFSGNDFVSRANLLNTFGFTFALIFAILILSGIILLFTEVKPKSTPQLPESKN